jgi:8-amino-7-oxononanoate synthase
MTDLTKKLEAKLQERLDLGNERKLKDINLPFDFVSNDYLGLARSKELSDRIKHRFESLGETNLNGASGSRLLSGNSKFAMALEEKLGALFNAEAALVFNSGYMANIALISTIANKDDTILYDQLSHVCLKEGAWMSRADARPFRHNDVRDLELKLKQATGDVFVIMETVYSMDGDIGPVEEIHKVCRYYGANLIVDEAHSTGIMGKNGNGYLNQIGFQEAVFAKVYTFGKAVGVHGACICGSKVLIDYLTNFCRPFIYTTGVSLHQLVSIEQAFDYLFDYPELSLDIQKKILHFQKGIKSINLGINKAKYQESNTAIQPIIIPGNNRLKKITSELQSLGFDIRPILSPTVKQGSERIRVCLHTHNSLEEIDDLIKNLDLLLSK